MLFIEGYQHLYVEVDDGRLTIDSLASGGVVYAKSKRLSRLGTGQTQHQKSIAFIGTRVSSATDPVLQRQLRSSIGPPALSDMHDVTRTTGSDMSIDVNEDEQWCADPAVGENFELASVSQAKIASSSLGFRFSRIFTNSSSKLLNPASQTANLSTLMLTFPKISPLQSPAASGHSRQHDSSIDIRSSRFPQTDPGSQMSVRPTSSTTQGPAHSVSMVSALMIDTDRESTDDIPNAERLF